MKRQALFAKLLIFYRGSRQLCQKSPEKAKKDMTKEDVGLGQEGTMKLERSTRLCKFVGNGDDRKPTESVDVKAGTYRVRRIENPVAEGCTPWIVIVGKDDQIIGMAEEPLRRMKIEITI